MSGTQITEKNKVLSPSLPDIFQDQGSGYSLIFLKGRLWYTGASLSFRVHLIVDPNQVRMIMLMLRKMTIVLMAVLIMRLMTFKQVVLAQVLCPVAVLCMFAVLCTVAVLCTSERDGRVLEQLGVHCLLKFPAVGLDLVCQFHAFEPTAFRPHAKCDN